MGSIIIIITLGAMLGKLIAATGAAQKIAEVLMKVFGEKYITWALALSGLVVGIPLFYGVGFVLMVPLIFSIVYQYKLPAVATGLPMIAALSVTHGFLPPHPSPTALVQLFHASMGLTLMYGLLIGIPAIIIAGPLFSSTLKSIKSRPLEMFQVQWKALKDLPGTAKSFLTALLPILLFTLTTFIPLILTTPALRSLFHFLGEGSIVMLISLIIATFTLGRGTGKSISEVMNIYGGAVKDVVMILLIIGGAGALKQVLTDSGTSLAITRGLETLPIQPLILGWLIAGLLRICVGSATIAGLTAAGIVAPLMIGTHTNPNLMVLSIGAGSLVLSHVNDSGFWLFKEYFNLTIKETFLSWTLMETIVSIIGLAGVLLINSAF
ncbi:MAG: gnt-II system L-idonate transporter [Flavisolibacter sp.]